MEVTVERRSITKEDLEQQQLLAKAKYAATKFDAEQKFNENITRRIAQDHLQYAAELFQEDMKQHFMTSFEAICSIQNKYLELWRSILHIEPTIAMRTILGREDIAARFVGERIVHIHACTEIKTATIFYNHTVNGTCYLETPITTKSGEMFFASPGSRDVFPVGKEISCDQVPTDIWHDQGKWISINGSVDVTPMQLARGFHQTQITPIKFTGANL
ncbi:unnamed protein product, partial [Auanema sp. JU1783]